MTPLNTPNHLFVQPGSSRRNAIKWLAGGALSISAGAPWAQTSGVFDHSYAGFDALLKQHVRWLQRKSLE